jgi:uncharacterized protein (UPF0335 family)
VDSHPAQAELVNRLKKRCERLEAEKAVLQEQLDEARSRNGSEGDGR